PATPEQPAADVALPSSKRHERPGLDDDPEGPRQRRREGRGEHELDARPDSPLRLPASRRPRWVVRPRGCSLRKRWAIGRTGQLSASGDPQPGRAEEEARPGRALGSGRVEVPLALLARAA